MTPVPDLIAQWHAKTLGGGALMRGLIAWDAWEVPISKAAATTALVENALPSIQLSTAKDGKIDLLLFSSPDAYRLYQKANNVSVAQHFVKLPGSVVFRVPMTGVERLWIDPLSPHDVYYEADQFARLHEVAAALAVEAALASLRRGDAADGTVKLVRDHSAYFVGMAQTDGGTRLMLAPDNKGRTLGAVFTSDDAYDAFLPAAKAQAGDAPVQQMQMSGAKLFDMLARMPLDGFVFNCSGPAAPVAFAHAMAKLVLDG